MHRQKHNRKIKKNAICMLLITTILSQNMMLFVDASTEKTQKETEDAYFKYHPSTYIKSYQINRHNLESSIETQENVNDCHEKTNDDFIVAAVQLKTLPLDDDSNVAEAFFHRAVLAIQTAVQEHNASLVLLQELFLGPYFCQSQESSFFSVAEDFDLKSSSSLSSSCLGNHHEKQNDSNNIMIQKMQSLAKQYSVILPISIFERKNNMYYNSVVMINASGEIVGVYRKSHIPDGTGYQEKFYFSPGDTGFQTFSLPVSKNSKDIIKIGVGICWDQWFPEAARSMALMGADLLLYPTAIGSEPQDPTLDSSDHWQRVMQGHAAANMIPVVAANRIGTEILLDNYGNEKQRIKFYGRSFITDETGDIIKEANSNLDMDIITSKIDFHQNRMTRAAWGLFRDRRPELYGILKTKDGTQEMN